MTIIIFCVLLFPGRLPLSRLVTERNSVLANGTSGLNEITQNTHNKYVRLLNDENYLRHG